MKTCFNIFIGLLLMAAIFSVQNLFAQNKEVLICDSYDSLLSAVKSGIPASINKTAYISDFSLIEKSKITIYPKNNEGYQVEIKILNIAKGDNSDIYEKNAILGVFAIGCKALKNNYNKFNNTSCMFYADNPEDAVDAAKNGISFTLDSKYNIEGSLVTTYKKLCMTEQSEPIPVKKPAVYLYPAEQMNVSVKVNVNGVLTLTDPEYNTGWNVNVKPNGIIDNKYDYLFYEADLNKIELPEEGWVVEYGNLKDWFDEYLPKLGLNKKEKEQFEEYWLGKLRKANYYDIRILDNKFLSENMRLIIDPKPESILRLNFHFKPISIKTELKAPEIKEFIRKGFTVIEWGGIDGGDLNS